ncbi:hypothetical protein APY03_0683 [Variovorax sp. WDL1]|nr:hypothetical protein APY03_0683 [Variovorax sp. WDL1]
MAGIPAQAEASRRARILARAHLDRVSKPNVFVAKSLEDLLRKALMLVDALEILERVRD